jgi:glycerol dehydrogenase
MDLGKLAARSLRVPLACAPTSVATCACATAVAVRNVDGAYGGIVDLEGPADLCLVDYGALRSAPTRLMAAGLADTLAKWLEWRALAQGPEAFGASAGWVLAKNAADCCVALGAAALAAPEGAEFEAVVEACLLGAAAASCLGSAPAAAAHSLANAVGRQAAGRGLLHGEAVALGLLWQESLLARSGSATIGVDAMRDLFRSWGLPTRLPEGLDVGLLESDVFAVDESVHLLGSKVELGGKGTFRPLEYGNGQ